MLCSVGLRSTRVLCQAAQGGQPRSWKTVEARREFLEAFARQNGIVDAEGWQGVRYADVVAAGGRGLLGRFKNSVRAAVSDAFPDMELSSRMHAPRAHWKERKNRRAFFDEVGEALGVKSVEDWGGVTKKQILERGGSGIIWAFKGSLRSALLDAYPELSADAWRARVPSGHWDSKENRREFMNEIAEKFEVEKAEDWQKVTVAAIAEQGGGGLLARYQNSLRSALADLYTDMDVATARMNVPKNHWDSRENRRAFMDHVADEAGVRDREDWQKVTLKDLVGYGGGGLLDKYCGSMYLLLQDVYELDDWAAFSLRTQTPKSFWEKDENIRSFLEHLREEFVIEKVEDWTRISYDQVRSSKGGNSFVKHMNLVSALKRVYDTEQWDDLFAADGRSSTQKRAAQRNLFLQLRKVFPSVTDASAAL